VLRRSAESLMNVTAVVTMRQMAARRWRFVCACVQQPLYDVIFLQIFSPHNIKNMVEINFLDSI
jgi:hypothetical protein